MIIRLMNLVIVGASLMATICQADSLEGKWCENGGPYTCYPPIENKSDQYTCIENTTVTKADSDTILWVINQTVHYYSNGLINGKNEPRQLTRAFKLNPALPGMVYEYSEQQGDNRQHWQLKVDDHNLEMVFEQNSALEKASVVHSKANYQRCNSDIGEKRFYTALIDCGGSGDYIAGVPAVVNNPLLWDLGENQAKTASCQVAARCWGGGWVAFAYSKGDDASKSAFGAACGGTSRHDAKQQAINSCRESGGSNCFYQVVSGYDDGSDELKDKTHKGSKVELCRNGDCELQAN